MILLSFCDRGSAAAEAAHFLHVPKSLCIEDMTIKFGPGWRFRFGSVRLRSNRCLRGHRAGRGSEMSGKRIWKAQGTSPGGSDPHVSFDSIFGRRETVARKTTQVSECQQGCMADVPIMIELREQMSKPAVRLSSERTRPPFNVSWPGGMQCES
jgi:hypothetical protein